MRYGADQADWSQFTLVLGLEPHLLPVVSNPNALISPASKIKKIGQIPSLYNGEHKVVGIQRWTEHQSTAADIARWSKEPDYGICIQTRAVRALDCDIIDADLSCAVYEFLLDNLPVPLPLRGRSNAPKFLMPFRLDGKYGKRVLRLNATNKIEFLADGQQFVAVGTHPSGVRYEWRGGLPTEIPSLTIEQFETLWKALKERFKAEESKEDFSERRPVGGDIDDEGNLDFLEKAGVVLGYSPEGSAYVKCPFAGGHSKEGDKTETIYFPAGLRGYEKGHFKCLHASCAGRADDEFLEALGFTASKFEALPDIEKQKLETGEQDFVWESAFTFSRRPKPEYIIRNVLPKADIAFIIGESRAGKSFLALDLAFAVARGVDWNGKKVKQGTVVYVCAEGSGDFRNRVLAYIKHRDISEEEFAKIPLHILTATPNLLDLKQARKLAASMAPFGDISLHFIDTLAQATPGANENGSEDMGPALSHCREIGRLTNSMSVLVHHTGHTNKDRGRGWSGMLGATDAEIVVSGIEGTREVQITKLKGGKTGQKWGMNLLTVGVDFYDDGEIMDSCAVEYVAPPQKDKKEREMGSVAKITWGVLENQGIDEGKRLKRYDIVDEGKLHIAKPSEGKDRRGEVIWQAVKGFAKKGMVVIEDDEVFINL